MKNIDITADWEGLCRQCGQCCFEKWVDEDGTIHPTRIACRFLDIHSRQCRVYHKRFEVGEGCIKLTPEVVETVQWLPEDCGYVQNVKQRVTCSRFKSDPSHTRSLRSLERTEDTEKS